MALAAVDGGRETDLATKYAAEVMPVAESAFFGNGFDGLVRMMQQDARLLDSPAAEVALRRPPRLLFEQARECIGRHSG